MNPNALLEIGVEEIPHEVLTAALDQLSGLTAEKMTALGIPPAAVTVAGTPRRLAVVLTGLAEMTPEKTVEKKGPAWKSAFDANGKPTRALEGFLASAKASVTDIVKKDVSGNEYVFLYKKDGGRRVSDILPDLWKDVIDALSFPKTMRWGTSKTQFVRPIRWILALAGNRTLPFSYGELTAGNVSLGHRLRSPGSFPVPDASAYLKTLEEHFVMADPAARRERIRSLVEEAAKAQKAKALLTNGLLDTLVNLTEYPEIAVGSYPAEFLDLPKEVLISEMVEHQKYVPLEDSSGKLARTFLVITNMPPSPQITAGNERVIRARFADGKFFYDEDRKRKLSDRLPELASVLFARDLGSLLDKTERIAANVRDLAALSQTDGNGLDFPNHADTAVSAARLCKADLVTGMVREFTELQGVIGYYYAKSSGEKEEVAAAVREHYWPRFSGDRLPSAEEGILVSLADRFDNLFALYARGHTVTGSKDPYALRRQTLGIIRILIEKKIRLEISSLFDTILPRYKGFLAVTAEDFRTRIMDFVTTRVKTVLKEYGFSYDEIDAGIQSSVSDIYDAYLRIQAIHEARSSDQFLKLSAAFKRVKNILQGQKAGTVSDSLLKLPAERDLNRACSENRQAFLTALEKRDYSRCVAILTSFKPVVDRFFDDVLVMDPDPALRNNRIALLAGVDTLFADFIDFEKLVTE